MAKDYNPQTQKLFIEIMLSDPELFVRIQNIYNPLNFDRSLKASAEYVKTYTEKYSKIPTLMQINAETAQSFEIVPMDATDESLSSWFMDEFETFTKQKELERAILKAADLLEQGDIDPVEKLIKDAVQISLTRDLGTNYWEDPTQRLKKILSNNGQVSTGLINLDKPLYGGMNKGELNIFMGLPNAGKSLFLQNLSATWIAKGLNGVYITLEMDEQRCAARIDSMLTGITTTDIFKKLDEVDLSIRYKAKSSGLFYLKYFPAQSNINDIRAYLKELQVKSGKKIDFLAVDYLDLLMPVSAKVSPSDLFVKDKYVSEELRNLAKELEIVLVTASQINRSGVDEIEYDYSHTSGGISKINTADNVFGIYTNRAMRERGQYQLQVMKTRSSNGVGTKVELDYNVQTLRLSDRLEGESSTPNKASDIMNRIKNRNESTSDDGGLQTPPKAIVNSNKLKDMLANLKNNNK